MIHVAVNRKDDYYHHYVILAKESVLDEYLKIVQYTVGVYHFLTGSSCGMVEELDIPITQVNEEIDEGLYVISGTNYPKSAKDFVKACARYLYRLGERAYHVVFNNCEHLANYIMNGDPESEQINKSDILEKASADTVDIIASDGKSNFVKSTIDSCGSAVAARQFLLAASKQVFSAASRIATSNTGLIAETSVVAKNLITYTAENIPACCPAEQMLCSETCCKVAETAGKNALKQTAIATGVLTVGVETGFAAWKIYKLRKMRNEGKIKERELKRETSKAIVTVPVASSLTVVGTVIGQALCPVPVVGVFVGAFVGNVIGRWGAAVVTGRIFDWWWP